MEEVYRKYSKLVYNYLYSLTNDSYLSEELMQETFYSAIKSINNFKKQCSISVWLCQIAKNKWKNHLLKSKKIKFVSIDDNIDRLLIENSFENMFKDEEIVELYKEIHKLDEVSKEIFYLKLKGNLTFKQIGEIFGKSEEWARITFYRGKLKLKEVFKNHE